jgi:hypothetical protein
VGDSTALRPFPTDSCRLLPQRNRNFVESAGSSPFYRSFARNHLGKLAVAGLQNLSKTWPNGGKAQLKRSGDFARGEW